MPKGIVTSAVVLLLDSGIIETVMTVPMGTPLATRVMVIGTDCSVGDLFTAKRKALSKV